MAGAPESISNARQKFSACRFTDDDPVSFGIASETLGHADYFERIRLRLLTDAVLIGPELMPKLHEVFRVSMERLGTSGGVQGYVYNDGAPQAQCIYTGEDATAAVLVSSGLVSLLEPDELRFVVGHEIGHLIYGHHSYPDPRAGRDDDERLNWLALQRAAEISSDRIGFLAAGTVDCAVRAIIKTSTGLSADQLRFDVAKYLDQLRNITSLGGNSDVIFASHPMFPVRMKALLWFEMSEPYLVIRGDNRRSPLNGEKLDERVARDLELAGASVLSRIREESIHSASVWAFLYVATADNKLSKEEQAKLAELYGEKVAKDALHYVQDHGPEGVREKFELSMRRIRSHPLTARKRFMRSLSDHFREESAEGTLESRMLGIIGDRLDLSR